MEARYLKAMNEQYRQIGRRKTWIVAIVLTVLIAQFFARFLGNDMFYPAMMVGWPVIIVCILLYLEAIKDEILIVTKMRQLELVEQLKSKGSQDV